ncbi:L-fucose:H+ symporter permease [Acidicapsa acidisoli]|uniref:L-fucose:H+ symporter permease n=1 Tax=Acidicapsa acidisoli TaxID=1615681 RepID=UPI0021E0D720|nr:L-fucose:H+ symporter permease [Acidicapsa acidisoli]
MNITVPSSQTHPMRESNQPIVPPGRMVPFVLVTALFYMWAIPNNLNDILIRQFMKSFALTRFEAGFIQTAFYLGYFGLAIPAGILMRRFGYKLGILTGLCLLASGSFLFWPAANAGSYSFFLLALFVIASGLSFLETAANPIIVRMGAPENSEQRLNFSQAFNPLGSITATLVGTVFIFSGVELTAGQIAAKKADGTYSAYLHSEIIRVVTPYLVLGIAALVLAFLIARTKFPSLDVEEEHEEGSTGDGLGTLLKRHFILGVVAQFLYVGAQVGTWSYFIQYVQSYAGVPERVAGYMLTGTLAAFAIGRFLSAWLLKYVRPDRLLSIFAACNVLLVLMAITQLNWVGVICLLCSSFFMSMMFPTIFALGIHGLGSRTKTGGSLMVMAIIGGAALTPVMGKISDAMSVNVAYSVPGACFLGIALYAWFGARPAKTTAA